MHAEVKKYIESEDADRQAQLHEIRNMILRELPAVVENFEWRFPCYNHNGETIAGFASRKKGPMFYIMDSAVLDGHREELGNLASGRSCVEFRRSRTISLERVRELCISMLAELKKKRNMK